MLVAVRGRHVRLECESCRGTFVVPRPLDHSGDDWDIWADDGGPPRYR